MCVAQSFESPIHDLCLRTCTVFQKAALSFTARSEPGLLCDLVGYIRLNVNLRHLLRTALFNDDLNRSLTAV